MRMAQNDRCFHAIKSAIEPITRSDDGDEFSCATARCIRDQKLGMRARRIEMDSCSSPQILVGRDPVVDCDRCLQIGLAIALITVCAPKNVDPDAALCGSAE